MGGLFGAVLARALDVWWDELGRPDPFVVVEAAAGTGTLARSILDAAPRCAPALRYVLVERSEALREQQAGVVPLEPPPWVLGPTETEDDELVGVPATGPLFCSLSELPAQPVIGVVFANELLDNLPPLLLAFANGRWCEVRVGEDGGRFVEVLVPASPELAEEAARLVPDPHDGARIPIQHRCREWLRSALAAVARGRVVVVDYADTTAAMVGRDFLRTYRAHGRGGDPLEAPGSQDVTCDVAVDQLRPSPTFDRTQAEFLKAHGIDDLVDAAKAAWQERAHLGDLEALRHRSRANEAPALLDPAGLGAFRVLEWRVP
ncbi:MAG TPA: SAM-dependent methyltransferase [Acidimicrobiales bacterium]|nr:SAM-dependent methyltransferase [Acidimicrobiales bacterium]